MDTDVDLKPTPEKLLKRAQGERSVADALEHRADTGMDDITEQRRVEYERRKGERDSDMQEFNRRSTDLQQTAEKGPAHVDMPNPKLGPMLDPQQTQNFAWGMLAMSLVGVAAGRKHWGMATAALDGMLQGMKAGDEEQIAERSKEFERELKTAKEKQSEAIRLYDDLLKSRQYSLNQVASLMKAHAAANEDWETWQLAESKNFEGMYRRVGQMHTAADRIDSQATRLQEQIDARREKAQDKRDAAKARENAGQDHGEFTDGDVKYWAEVMQKGGSLPPRLATTPGGKWLTQQVMSSVSSSGTTPSEMLSNQAEFQGQKAGQRTLGTRTANVEMAVTEAQNMAQIVLDTSSKFDRTNFIPINKAYKAFKDNTGNTESRQFGAAINSFMNAYARAISPSGVPTVHDKEHAREMLSAADSHQQVEAIMKTLQQEMEAARKSPGQVKDSMREGFTGGGKTTSWEDLPK